jgi:hypothetical protein
MPHNFRSEGVQKTVDQYKYSVSIHDMCGRSPSFFSTEAPFPHGALFFVRLLREPHTILTIVYMILTRKQPYQDLGAAYFDQREQHRVERRLVQRLERLGYEVSLQPKALAS